MFSFMFAAWYMASVIMGARWAVKPLKYLAVGLVLFKGYMSEIYEDMIKKGLLKGEGVYVMEPVSQKTMHSMLIAVTRNDGQVYQVFAFLDRDLILTPREQVAMFATIQTLVGQMRGDPRAMSQEPLIDLDKIPQWSDERFADPMFRPQLGKSPSA